MAVMLAYLKVPLSWREILTRTGREAMADNVFGMAAQLAYYFFFALFPALLLLIRDDRDHQHAERGLRHRGRTPLVEGAADGHRADDRRCAVHHRFVRAC